MQSSALVCDISAERVLILLELILLLTASLELSVADWKHSHLGTICLIAWLASIKRALKILKNQLVKSWKKKALHGFLLHSSSSVHLERSSPSKIGGT